MAGFFRFAIFATLLVGLLVLVVLPAVASPLLTQLLRGSGLRGEDLRVSIDYFDASLFTGTAERLTITGSDVELPPALVGRVDLTLEHVSLIDRTFDTISGQLRNVTLAAGGLTVEVDSVQVDGPAAAAAAIGRLTGPETQRLVERAARRAGIALDSVRLVEGGLRLQLGRSETRAALAVRGGALVLAPTTGPPVLLLQPAAADPWRLAEASVSPSGVIVSGVFDAETLAGHVLAGTGR